MIWPQQIPSVPQTPPSDPGMTIAPLRRSPPLEVEDETEPRQDLPGPDHHVVGWMQGLVATCGPEQTLGELTELLSLHQISGVPVVDDEGTLLGVVSQTDVAAYLGGLYSDEIRGAAGFYQGLMGRISSSDPGVRALLETRTVEQLLTPHVHYVSPDATLDEVIDLMLNQHVHRLPVVRKGKLVGLVSTLDVLREIRDQRQL